MIEVGDKFPGVMSQEDVKKSNEHFGQCGMVHQCKHANNTGEGSPYARNSENSLEVS